MGGAGGLTVLTYNLLELKVPVLTYVSLLTDLSITKWMYYQFKSIACYTAMISDTNSVG